MKLERHSCAGVTAGIITLILFPGEKNITKIDEAGLSNTKVTDLDQLDEPGKAGNGCVDSLRITWYMPFY